MCRRISVATLSFIAGFPQTDFDTKLVNFKNCHINKLDNYFIYLVFAYFLVFLVGVYSCSYSFPSKFLP